MSTCKAIITLLTSIICNLHFREVTTPTVSVRSIGLNCLVGYLHFSHIVRTVEGLRSTDAVVWQFVTEC